MAHTSPQTEHKFPLLIVLVTILVGIGFCAISIVLLTRGSAYATVVETITGETPETKVGAYMNAVARGDVTQALTLWERSISFCEISENISSIAPCARLC